MKRILTLVAVCVLGGSVTLGAQRGAPPAPANARQGAPIDLTGYWVSVVTEDWKFRMVTPNKGEFGGLPLNAEGQKVGKTWDPARDEAAGEQCRAYGAPAIMRIPGRLHVTWQDDNTLKVDTDAGTQTRLLRFGAAVAPAEPSWQGHSVAQWNRPGLSLKVLTNNLRMGYVRKNGAPYSDKTVVTEYFDVNTMPNGDQVLTVTTKVEDAVYFTRPFLTSSDFKKLPDATGWSPSPCSAR
ncbi:MAG TPA: hypothetical protein VM818_23540 [Vicinamibacterales bacterium]|jgi:hypothetical protein|nr:hypothetical protein [Vicinamibacterales bacterium]